MRQLNFDVVRELVGRLVICTLFICLCDIMFSKHGISTFFFYRKFNETYLRNLLSM